MKVELDIMERAFVSNVLRRRAMEAHENAKATKSDRQRSEFEKEARTAEDLAIRFDNGEPLITEQPTPIVADGRRDLDYIDEKKGEDTETRRARRTGHAAISPPAASGPDSPTSNTGGSA